MLKLEHYHQKPITTWCAYLLPYLPLSRSLLEPLLYNQLYITHRTMMRQKIKSWSFITPNELRTVYMSIWRTQRIKIIKRYTPQSTLRRMPPFIFVPLAIKLSTSDQGWRGIIIQFIRDSDPNLWVVSWNLVLQDNYSKSCCTTCNKTLKYPLREHIRRKRCNKQSGPKNSLSRSKLPSPKWSGSTAKIQKPTKQSEPFRSILTQIPLHQAQTSLRSKLDKPLEMNLGWRLTRRWERHSQTIMSERLHWFCHNEPPGQYSTPTFLNPRQLVL